MDLEMHRRILSIAHLVTGFFNIMIWIFILFLADVLGPIAEDQLYNMNFDGGEDLVHFIMCLFHIIGVFVILMIGLPSVIGAILILNKRFWGFYLLLVSGCLSIFNFPIGTAKGIYTIWAYLAFHRKKYDEN